MRIAFVSTMSGCSWGGSEELWSRAALRMQSNGHQTFASVYKWTEMPQQLRLLQSSGCHIHLREFKASLKSRIITRLCNRDRDLIYTNVGIKWLKSICPDLVLISQGFPLEGLEWMLACQKLSIRYASVIQSASEAWWPTDRILAKLRNAYRGACSLFFVTRSNSSLLEAQCGVKFQNIQVINNPFNVDIDVHTKWPADREILQLACVARIDPRTKGQDLLLSVMAMNKWRDRPLMINFYGSGPCEEAIRGTVELYNLDNVTFHGHTSDIISVWRRNHGLVLPSRIEGLPLAIVEAMYCRRFVITTDVAGNADFIIDGINGFVASAPTKPLLDDAMERAWLQRSEWKAMGERSRQSILESIPVDPTERFVDALSKLVQS